MGLLFPQQAGKLPNKRSSGHIIARVAPSANMLPVHTAGSW